MELVNLSPRSGTSSRIKLDVGGRIFHVSRETLIKQDSFFSSMFSGKFSIMPESDGTYFIDRDPDLFPHILNYLRNGSLALHHFSKAQIELLHAEAIYYSLASLQRQIESHEAGNRRGFLPGLRYDISVRPSFKSLSEPFVFEATKPSDKLSGNRIWNVTILGNALFLPESGVYEFFIRINATSFGNLMIGIAPHSVDQSKEANHKSTGWYLARTSRLHTADNECEKNESFDIKDLKFIQGTIIGWRVDLIKNSFAISYNFGEFQPAFSNLAISEGTPLISVYLSDN